MSQQSASANGRGATAVAVPERPALAPGVQLLGEMPDTGFKDKQWLVQRGERYIQTTELLYRVAERATGEHTLEQIAAGVTESTEWLVSADDVRRLIEGRLIPLGLVSASDDDSAVEEARHQEDSPRSALQIRMRMMMLGPRVINPITRVLQVLYAPPVLVLFLVAAVLAHVWLYVYAARSVLGGLLEFIYKPELILLMAPIVVLANVFHEFGHASALRYGGGQVRGMGIGMYVITPVLYMDTTDSYRLGRWARVRTDLGGFYFWLIFQLGLIGLYLFSGQEFLLLIAVLIDVEMLLQSLPFVRFDGYWAFASLTGIPDPLSQVVLFLRKVSSIPEEKLRSLLPLKGGHGGRLPELKPWVTKVFALWVALTIPALAAGLFVFVWFGPTFWSAMFDSFVRQLASLSAARDGGDLVGAAAAGMRMFLLALNMLGIAYFAYVLLRLPVRALWNWIRRTPGVRTAGAVVLVAGAGAGAVYLWAPNLNSSLLGAPPDGVRTFEVTQRDHVETPVAYAQTPPVGGNHAPVWQNCGFYDRPVRNENAVHSMEHGAVWVAYRPDLPAGQVDLLRQLTQRQNYVLASPHPDLPAPVVASAWGRQLSLNSAEDPRLNQFVRAFTLGDQTPEPGAPCTGGTGTPS